MQTKVEDLLRRSLARNTSLLLSAFDAKLGRWEDAQDDDALFANYVAIWACQRVGLRASKQAQAAARWIEGQRKPSGVWTYERNAKPVEATARALSALIQIDDALTAQDIDASVSYLLTRQMAQGGWGDQDSDIPIGAPGIGQTLPAMLALRVYTDRFGQDERVMQAMDRCRLWLQTEAAAIQPDGADWDNAPMQTLMRAAWFLRALRSTATPPSVHENALAAGLLKHLRTPQSSLWNAANYQNLYNVVHTLGLVGQGLGTPEVSYACLWLDQRWVNRSRAHVQKTPRELRHLAGTVLAESAVLNATPGTSANIAELLTFDSGGLVIGSRFGDVEIESGAHALNLFNVSAAVWGQLPTRSRLFLAISIFTVVSGAAALAWNRANAYATDRIAAATGKVTAALRRDMEVRVIDASGAPVSGAKVEFAPHMQPEAYTTNAEGRVAISFDYVEREPILWRFSVDAGAGRTLHSLDPQAIPGSAVQIRVSREARDDPRP